MSVPFGCYWNDKNFIVDAKRIGEENTAVAWITAFMIEYDRMRANKVYIKLSKIWKFAIVAHFGHGHNFEQSYKI